MPVIHSHIEPARVPPAPALVVLYHHLHHTSTHTYTTLAACSGHFIHCAFAGVCWCWCVCVFRSGLHPFGVRVLYIDCVYTLGKTAQNGRYRRGERPANPSEAPLCVLFRWPEKEYRAGTLGREGSGSALGRATDTKSKLKHETNEIPLPTVAQNLSRGGMKHRRKRGSSVERLAIKGILQGETFQHKCIHTNTHRHTHVGVRHTHTDNNRNANAPSRRELWEGRETKNKASARFILACSFRVRPLAICPERPGP